MVNKSIAFFSAVLVIVLYMTTFSCQTPQPTSLEPVVLTRGDTLHQYSLDAWGAIIRADKTQPTIRLLFTGHDFADGMDSILATLEKQAVKGYFFFTGDFIRAYTREVQQVMDAGHYIGCHSNHHLLYADWTERDSLLISYEQWKSDLDSNYLALKPFGIERKDHTLFMAPYEWYNQAVGNWCREAGLTLINFTPGMITQADYTVPEDKNYRSTAELVRKTLQNARNGGLNGAFLLIHVGSSPFRTDKLYWELDTLIEELKKMGYRFS